MSGPPSKDHVDATAYLVVEGIRSLYSYGNQRVQEAKIVGVRQGKPGTLSKDQVSVRVTIRLPKSAFEALQPEALIVVSEEMVQKPIEVEAEDP